VINRSELETQNVHSEQCAHSFANNKLTKTRIIYR